MMLSPLSQPAVRPLYNGGSKSAARGTPWFAWYVIRCTHSDQNYYRWDQFFWLNFLIIRTLKVKTAQNFSRSNLEYIWINLYKRVSSSLLLLLPSFLWFLIWSIPLLTTQRFAPPNSYLLFYITIMYILYGVRVLPLHRE